MIVRRFHEWHSNPRARAWTEVGLILVVGALVYSPVLAYSFFWEDPFDIGQVEPYSYAEVLVVPNSNSYYRPVALVILKALKLGGDGYPAWAYHAFIVTGHFLAGAILYGFTLHLFRRHRLALAAALIHALYPVPFESTARASSFHPWLQAAALAVLWLYVSWRDGGFRARLIIAFALSVAALGLHENAVLLPGLILVLELWLVWQRRVARFSPAALAFWAPALAFVAIWLSIPKSGEAPQVGLHRIEALYLSQGLSFAAAGPISVVGGFGLAPEGQATLALVIAAALLVLVHRDGGLPRLALALAWWGVAVSLAWLARPIEYLEFSPRVLYFPSFAVGIAWAGVAEWGEGEARVGTARRLAALAATGAVLGLCWWSLLQSVRLYTAGSNLMDQIVAAGERAGPNGRVLFVNVPDRFELKTPLFPMGYWGMLLAPVSQDLGDFVWLARGVRPETRSLSSFPLLAAQMEPSPYRVNARGVDAYASDLLYDTLVWAGDTYLTEYAADGQIALRAVGDVRPAAETATPLGRFADVAELTAADAAWDGSHVSIVLRWRPIRSARPTDTVFVHVLDSTGSLLAQADGDSLGGLLPPSAWRPGHEILDLRTTERLPGWPTGQYRIAVGMYDRATSVRYPAYDATGRPQPDGALDAVRLTIP